MKCGECDLWAHKNVQGMNAGRSSVTFVTKTGGPLKLMMTPVCPRLLNMITDFFCASGFGPPRI